MSDCACPHPDARRCAECRGAVRWRSLDGLNDALEPEPYSHCEETYQCPCGCHTDEHLGDDDEE